jgi:hypothetical protein
LPLLKFNLVCPAPTGVTEAKLNEKEQKSTIERPSKRGRQVLREQKPITKPFSLQEEHQSETVTKEKVALLCSVSENRYKVPEYIIPAPTVPLNPEKIQSPEAFHTRSKTSRKDQSSIKPKLCTVPAVQQQHSEMSGSTEQTPHVESIALTQIKSSDIQPIPAPCILMPSRSQFTQIGRLASSQTRSIGIQVDLQPTSDIKIM